MITTLIQSRFHLPKAFRQELAERPVEWGFGLLSEAAYYRTYSRLTEDGKQESWADTVVRVTEGALSVRKEHLTRVLGVSWDQSYWEAVGQAMATAIFEMRMLPPGRGLWAMGTDFIYERGSLALNNCGYCSVEGSLSDAAAWIMDALMCGVGVGFSTHHANFRQKPPTGEPVEFQVPDTREGWVESVRRLIASYEHGSRPLKFDYSLVRRAGQPIRGFGGIAAGPGPLRELHERLREYLGRSRVPRSRTVADVVNAVGCCVVAGNVRRSAEIALGRARDSDFLHLKDYELHPERGEIGWMSNNSVVLDKPDDFEELPDIAPLVANNGEPGILNLINVKKYGRLGERKHDDAVGVNPCGEIALESKELCNLVEVFPTRCGTKLDQTLELATLYASTVSLLPSHSPDTNAVVARNRRIGVSISGVADWIDSTSVSYVFGVLNRMYEKVVRPTNERLAREAGVPPSVRVTTVKPSGTVSLLAGVSSGVHWPVAGYVLRRMRLAKGSGVAERLAAAGVPHEPDVVSSNTEVFEFPLHYGRGRTRSVKHVSVFEQAATVAMLQRCWADNAVSNTLTVQPDELRHVERVLALFAPQVKSLSLLPDRAGVYEQMPLEQITKEEFEKRSAALQDVSWTKLKKADAVPDRYCENDSCEVPL